MANLKENDEADKSVAEDPYSDYEHGRQAGYKQGFKDARAITLIAVMNALFSSEALVDDND